MVAHMLLGPAVPLLFQGEEFAASSPFLYFADHQGELGQQVKKGRQKFLAQFPTMATPQMQGRLADPGDPQTFRRCVLDHSERESNRTMVALYRDLLALRRDDAAFDGTSRLEAATLGEDAWVLRYIAEGSDRLVIVNLGHDLVFETIPEPLLAPVEGRGWRLLWSSETPEYGGAGIPEPVADGVWHIPGQATIVLAPGDRAASD